MNLVDNINAVPESSGHIGNIIANITDIVDSVVGGGIHFNHIDCPPFVNGAARFAFSARLPILRAETVQGFCKDLRTAGLSGSAGAAEQISMTGTVMRHLIAQN